MKTKDVILDAEGKSFKELEFNLKIEKLKPVFTSIECTTNKEFNCMLDSGAGIPVWCTGMNTLMRTFSNAVLKPELKGMLSGFGSGFIITDVFYIPKAEICNGKESIIFKDFYLPVMDRGNFGADLVIPSSMFKNSNILLSQCTVSGKQKKLFIQYQAEFYKAQYTVRWLTAKGVSNLNKICKAHNITMDTKIIGGEGEFYKVLVQDNLHLLLEQDIETSDIRGFNNNKQEQDTKEISRNLKDLNIFNKFEK